MTGDARAVRALAGGLAGCALAASFVAPASGRPADGPPGARAARPAHGTPAHGDRGRGAAASPRRPDRVGPPGPWRTGAAARGRNPHGPRGLAAAHPRGLLPPGLERDGGLGGAPGQVLDPMTAPATGLLDGTPAGAPASTPAQPARTPAGAPYEAPSRSRQRQAPTRPPGRRSGATRTPTGSQPLRGPAATAGRGQPSTASGSPARRDTAARAARAPRRASTTPTRVAGAPTVGARGSGPSAPVAAAPRPAPAPQATRQEAADPATRVIQRIERVIPTPLKAGTAALVLLAALLGLRSLLAGRRARGLDRERRALQGDVGLLQSALLPEVPTDLTGIEVSAAYRPADGPAAGGDFFDVVALDDARTAFVLGDVCGHGREALSVSALMRYTLRSYLTSGLEPRLALRAAGRALQGDPASELTTVVLALYDPSEGTLTYACAGHEPPVLLGVPGARLVTARSAPPLGGFMATGQRQTTVVLPPGSSACLFTDGLVEGRTRDRTRGRARLEELLADVASPAGAQELLDRVAADNDGALDDMAACLIRVRSDERQAAARQVEQLEVDARALGDEGVSDFLRACGVGEADAAEALVAARGTVAELGSALLAVTCGEDARVEVLAPGDTPLAGAAA